jgi:hypothetical protein
VAAVGDMLKDDILAKLRRDVGVEKSLSGEKRFFFNFVDEIIFCPTFSIFSLMSKLVKIAERSETKRSQNCPPPSSPKM